MQGVFVYYLIWIIFQEGCSPWKCTHSQIPRRSCIMHQTSSLWLYSNSCPHNDTTLVLCLFHIATKHIQQGNCYPKQILSPQTICTILQSRQSVSARVVRMVKCFAHYRRRLPVGSLGCTITALWGYFCEAKKREQHRERVWRCLVGFCLFLHNSSFAVLSFLLCPCFTDMQT